MTGMRTGDGIKVDVTVYQIQRSPLCIRKLNWVLKTMPKSKQLAEAFARATAEGMAPVR